MIITMGEAMMRFIDHTIFPLLYYGSFLFMGLLVIAVFCTVVYKEWVAYKEGIAWKKHEEFMLESLKDNSIPWPCETYAMWQQRLKVMKADAEEVQTYSI